MATALFSISAAIAKILVTDYHVLQILLFRQIVVFLSSLPSVVHTLPGSLKLNSPLLHSARLLGSFTAMACGIWAVSVLPLTTATTLAFAQVFFVTLLAMYFLKETVGKHRIFAIIVGFIGVIVVMRPGVDGFLNIHALIPIAAAMGAGVAIVSIRKLSQSVSTATLLIYQATFIGVIAAIPMYWLWVTPDLPGLILLLSMGAIASGGHWIGIKALRLGEASVIGSIQYVQLVYAAILGYVLFSEIPDRYTLIGAFIIIGSSAYILRREALLKKRKQIHAS